MEITITGIRYTICPANMSKEDMDTYTENYLSKIPKGEKIILKAQPDNPVDPYAIAAYIHYSQRIGYVNAGELDDVRPLLDKNELLECSVVRWDHVTLFVEAEGETAFGSIELKESDKFAPTPFEDYAKLSLENEEHSLDIISLRLFNYKLPDDDIPDEWLCLVEKFVNGMNLSISQKHLNRKGRIRTLLRKLCVQYGGKKVDKSKLCRLEALSKAADSHVSDTARDGGKYIVFANQLKRLREHAKEEHELFQKFDKHRLILSATDGHKICTIDKIDDWLMHLPDGIGTAFLTGEYNSFATKVAYQKPSTNDVYRLASVLLIRERMKGETYYDSIENTPQDQGTEYPEISDVNRRLFADTYFVEISTTIGKKKQKRDVPKDKILHSIFDITKEWDPAVRTSVHKWKMMYVTLDRMGYIRQSDRKQYKLFVSAIVAYCFPSVKESYCDNISRTYLDDNYNMWEDEDKQLYKQLRDALTF